MTASDGDRPTPPQRPTNPSDGPPRSSFQDPAKLARAEHMIRTALSRAGLTYADLRPPEHVRAA